MIEQYNLSFLELNKISKILYSAQAREHGLVGDGVSSYNYGMPILMYPELRGLKLIIKQYIRLFCTKYEIAPLKFINSWYNITDAGNELKPHNHPQSIVSGAFYLSGKVPLIFPDTKVEPYPGLLVIFSSDLVHYTEPEKQQRTVISFNTDYEL
jgi:hypothetical protein